MFIYLESSKLTNSAKNQIIISATEGLKYADISYSLFLYITVMSQRAHNILGHSYSLYLRQALV